MLSGRRPGRRLCSARRPVRLINSRLWIGRNSSTCGSMVLMPRARASKPSKRSSGLSQTSRRQERCSRSISKAERIVGVALKPVGDEQHDRALGEHAARPQLVEGAQRRGDARAARPIRHAAEQAASASSGSRSRSARVTLVSRVPNKNVRDALSRVGERVQEMQEDAAVLAHRAGNIEQRHDRRRLGLRPDESQIDEIAAAFHAGAQRAADVDEMTVRMRRQPPRAHLVERQHQPLHRRFRRGDFGAGHLREIFLLQHFAVGHRQARVELDLAALFSACRRARKTAPHARASRRPAALAARSPAPAASSSR